MSRITHPPVQQMLAGRATLPCVFTLRSNSSDQPPSLLWTHTGIPVGGKGAPWEQVVLSAKGEPRMGMTGLTGDHYSPSHSFNPLDFIRLQIKGGR